MGNEYKMPILVKISSYIYFDVCMNLNLMY